MIKNKDKFYHFSISLIGSLLIGRYMYIPGIGKELLDEYRWKFPPKYDKIFNELKIYGTGWSWGDIVADIIGVELGILIRKIIIIII